MVLIITGDVNVTSVVPPQQRMTAQGLWSARRFRECAASRTHAHTASVHTQSQTYRFHPKVNHMCPLIIPTTRGMPDSFGFVPAGCSTVFSFFLTDTQKYLCVKIEGLWEIREGCGSGGVKHKRESHTSQSKFIHTIRYIWLW